MFIVQRFWRPVSFRRTMALMVSAILAVQPMATAMAQSTGKPETGGRDRLDVYASCNVQTEAAFRDELKYITKRALERGTERIDFNEVVKTQWKQNRMPVVMRGEVQRAVAEVKEERSLVERVRSIVSKAKAKELARDVADRAYQSDKFKAAIEDLASDVAQAVSGQIELAAADSARPAVKCVRTFLGEKYGPAIAGYVAADTDASFRVTGETGQATVGTGSVVLDNSALIGGTVLLLVRRSIARIARQIGRRVVGSILSRIASVAAGGVGLALIAYDVFSMRNGVLPIIEKEMVSEDTQSRIQKELSLAISEQMVKQMDEVSERSADKVVAIWQEFRNAHTQVISFANESPRFKRFLDGVGRADVPKTDRLVALILEGEGKDGVVKRIENGTLGEAVKTFDSAAVQVALDVKSLDTAQAWVSLAGGKIDAVKRYGLHRAISPSDISAGALQSLLGLDDSSAIATLVALSPSERNAVLELGTEQLAPIARQLTSTELSAFAGYRKQLEPRSAKRLLDAVRERPSVMRGLAPETVRTGILNSGNQMAALNMMLRDGSPFEFANLPGDLKLAYQGDVSPLLLWYRSPVMVGVILSAIVLTLLMLSRMIFGGRRRRRARAR